MMPQRYRIAIVSIQVIAFILYLIWLSLDYAGPWFSPYAGIWEGASVSPNWHSFFMMLAFGVCYPVMLMLQDQILTTRLYIFTGLLACVGLVLIFISKDQEGWPHYYSAHSWMGLLSMAIFVVLVPQSGKDMTTLWAFVWWTNFALILMTLMMGMLQISYLVDFFGTNHFTAQKLLPNFCLMCFAFLGFVVFHHLFFAPPKPAREPIQTKTVPLIPASADPLLAPKQSATHNLRIYYFTQFLIVSYMTVFLIWVTLPDMDGFGPFEISDHGFPTPNEPSGASWTLSHSWHFLGVNLAFPVCMSEALMLIQFRRTPGQEIDVKRFKNIKTWHIVMHTLALVFGTFGVYAMFKNHHDRGDYNFNSAHCWLALYTCALFVIGQFFVGLFQNYTHSLNLPLHRYLGVGVYWGMLATCILGIFEKQYFKSNNEWTAIVILADIQVILLIAIGVCTALQLTFLPVSKQV